MEKARQLSQLESVVRREKYKRDLFLWLSEAVKTIDEHDKENPVKPLPVKPYTKRLIEIYERENIIWLVKSRQVMMTWNFMAIGLHLAQFFDYRKVIVNSKKEEDAFELVERMKFIYDHQPLWLKNLCPLAVPMKNQRVGHLKMDNGSWCFGLSQGPDQIRQHTGSLIILDEAAFQEMFEETFGACQPSIFGGGKIVIISSAYPGYFQRATGYEHEGNQLGSVEPASFVNR